ncbi:MAG: sensor histidine kinase [Gorillibacterium sp.]|nr:sensor histidine kinase [Gorillibacterium sp.]
MITGRDVDPAAYYQPGVMKVKRIPYGVKLLSSYLLILLIPILLNGYFSYRSSERIITAASQKNIQGILQQISDNVEYKLQMVKRGSDQLFYDEDLQLTLNGSYEGWFNYEATTTKLLPKVNSAANMAVGHSQIIVYLDQENLPEVYSGTENPLQGNRFEIRYTSGIAGEDWFRSLGDPGIDGAWFQTEKDRKYGTITHMRSLIDFNSFPRKRLGYIRVIIGLKDILEAVDYEKVGFGSRLVLSTGSGSLLYNSFAQNQGGAPGNVERIHLTQKIPGVDWQLDAWVPLPELKASANELKWNTILVSIMGALALAGISVWMSGFFSKRIHIIVRSLNIFREGDFSKRIRYRGNDELSDIADAFNEMAETTEHLIEQVYTVNLRKKEAELTSLQSQINPHFLYNTLSSISRLGKMGKVDEMHRMVMGLARFYRLTLNHGRLLISIRDEFEQVRSYLDIQKIKYGERMDIHFEVEPSLLDCETVKVIVQPFVENALLHAWRDENSLKLAVRLEKEEDHLVITVEDDGIGIPEELLKELSFDEDHSLGYGIRNVNERIKLQYGERYGVRLFRIKEGGTRVELHIPAIPMKPPESKEEESH